MSKFKVGDRVRLVSLGKSEIEVENWILSEDPLPCLGDLFTVSHTEDSTSIISKSWIRLEGCNFDHPDDKFELASNWYLTDNNFTRRNVGNYSESIKTMKRNIELTLEQAKDLAAKHPELKEVLLNTFPELESKVPDKWEDLKSVKGYFIDNFSKVGITPRVTCNDVSICVFATEKQALSALAAAQLSQLMKATGDCDVNWANTDSLKHVIARVNKTIKIIKSYDYYYFLAFNTESIRDEFCEKHISLIKQYFEL